MGFFIFHIFTFATSTLATPGTQLMPTKGANALPASGPNRKSMNSFPCFGFGPFATSPAPSITLGDMPPYTISIGWPARICWMTAVSYVRPIATSPAAAARAGALPLD